MDKNRGHVVLTGKGNRHVAVGGKRHARAAGAVQGVDRLELIAADDAGPILDLSVLLVRPVVKDPGTALSRSKTPERPIAIANTENAPGRGDSLKHWAGRSAIVRLLPLDHPTRIFLGKRADFGQPRKVVGCKHDRCGTQIVGQLV